MRVKRSIPLVCLLLIGGCSFFRDASRQDSYSPALTAALEAAGSNRGELEAVLDHYRGAGDTLKLRAAGFLLENMEGKCFVDYALRDSSSSEIDFNVLDYPDYESMVAVLDSLEAEKGALDFERVTRIDDLEVVKASYLIEDIDLAFRAWRENRWARHLDFESFCAYVLPYRGSNEPLEAWRRPLMEKLRDLASRMEDPGDPVEAARRINEELKSWFRFDPRFYCHPTDQSYSEMQQNQMGRCEDMTNLAIYAMRAAGLAVTSDYTPYWANAGNNHAWNSILDAEGRAVMFMGCEADPGSYKLANRPAKVYRKMFAEQKGNLAFLKSDGEKVPRWLSGKSYIDVTPDYVEVSDLTLSLDVAPPDSVHFGYLCVFNSGEWRAIDWGRLGNQSVSFRQIGRGIAYLPAYYLQDEILPAAPPFLLEEDGSITSLSADSVETQTVYLRSTTRREPAESTDRSKMVFLASGLTYQLSYWKDRWVALGDRVATEEPLVFEDVPAGGLYWLTETGSRREERIFTYEQERQVWW